MIADDLFAGCGGWDLGAAAVGIEARGIELMPEARATREAADLVTIHDDVWTFQPDGTAEGGIGSPPCQTFSISGSGSGRRALADVLTVIREGRYLDLEELRAQGERFGDDRTALVLTPLHFAVTGTYRWLAWEQVSTVRPVWQACAEVLRRRGWNVWTGPLHAEAYGVPQTRTRDFLIASLDHPVAPPMPTHSRFYSHAPGQLDEGMPRWVTMQEALGFGLSDRPAPTITGGGIAAGGAEPISHLARFASSPSWVQRSNYNGTAAAPRRERTTRRLDQPSVTLTGRPPSWAAPHVNPFRLTVEECCVIQTLPVDHPLQGTKNYRYLQAGNSVPPMLARQVLLSATGRAPVAGGLFS